MRRRRYQERGFSLVEMLVCMSIVAMVVAVAAPRVHGAMMRSRETQVQEDLKMIETALEQHYLEQHYYPVKLNDLILRGYLRPNANFQSPVSDYWYFYAVDDNREDGLAQAFALGAPPRNAENEDLRRLHRGSSLPFPQGRRPDFKARAWLRWEITDGGRNMLKIFLYYEGDHFLIHDPADLPASLSDYRFSCRSSSPSPCDLRTN